MAMQKKYAVVYTPNAHDPYAERYVGSIWDYQQGGCPDPIELDKEQADTLLQELDNYVRNDEDFGDNREQALWAYENGGWGFWIEEHEPIEED